MGIARKISMKDTDRQPLFLEARKLARLPLDNIASLQQSEITQAIKSCYEDKLNIYPDGDQGRHKYKTNPN